MDGCVRLPAQQHGITYFCAPWTRLCACVRACLPLQEQEAQLARAKELQQQLSVELAAAKAAEAGAGWSSS